jgi:NAD(P)-dependent dehydrogenase (short-subunit alcohol dehydrogenase family)
MGTINSNSCTISQLDGDKPSLCQKNKAGGATSGLVGQEYLDIFARKYTIMNELFSIKGQVVVVTGGTGVLGSCISKYLATQGCKVAILGRRAEAGEKIVAEITEAGGQAAFFTTDVMKVEVVQQNLTDIVAKFGRVDALINAAGGNMPGATIGPNGTFFDLDPEAFRTVLDLNLTGTVIPTQVFLKQMVEQGKGNIINFSSMAAFRPMTRVCGYAAAKAGISNFTAYMAHEVAKKFGEQFRVNAIAPGFFLTEQNRLLLTDGKGNLTERGQDVIRQTPFGRFGRAEELNGTVQYLLSEAASFVSGTVAVVDGGFNVFAM